MATGYRGVDGSRIGGEGRGTEAIRMVKPKMVIIEVTNRCNLMCKGCPTCTGESVFPIGDMDYDLFTSIIDRMQAELPEATICAWMLGEPLLHPRYLDMCKYMSEAGLKFYVTTNLTYWRQDVIEFLLSHESTCYQIIVSMDGLPGSGNIARARPGTDEVKLLSNLRSLMQMKRARNSACDIAVKICGRGQDYEEIEDYVMRWVDDADYVCIGRMLTEENAESMRVYPCQEFDNQFMAIRWNGTLILCDYNLHAANEGAGVYGVLGKEGSLIEAYNVPTLASRRAAQKAGRFFYPCDKCASAYTGAGMRGKVTFRNDPHKREIFYKADYYNTFFSLVDKGKPDSYYARGQG